MFVTQVVYMLFRFYSAVSLITVIFCIVLFPYNASGIGGISNTKVVVPSTETVPLQRYEIEPFFGFVFNDAESDKKRFESGSRFTYGFTDYLEAGFNFGILNIEDSPSTAAEYDNGNIEAGVKYRFFEFTGINSFSLAYQGGMTFPTRGSGEDWLFEPVGFILTNDFHRGVSIDGDIVLSFEEDNNWGLAGNIGLGYHILQNFQPVVEIGYEYQDEDGSESLQLLGITGGFTAEVNDQLTVIIGVTRDVLSSNTPESTELTAAFTFLF